MISGANENELEIANARADVLLSINDDRQHLLGLIEYWREECFRYKKENERLNNVLNELEKLWKEQQEYYRYRKDNRYRSFLSKNLDKLKELKESDK